VLARLGLEELDGNADPVVPHQNAVRLRDALTKAGFKRKR
jgi:predicted esterase